MQRTLTDRRSPYPSTFLKEVRAMRCRISLLALVLLAAYALAGGAASLPVSPTPGAPMAVAPPSPAANPDWLRPAPNSTPEKPGAAAKKPGTGAPLGAIFKNACSSACLQDETACFNGCGGDHSCNVSCSDDYYCCLRTCNPTGPQCF
jgi:hypothetical protein